MDTGLTVSELIAIVGALSAGVPLVWFMVRGAFMVASFIQESRTWQTEVDKWRELVDKRLNSHGRSLSFLRGAAGHDPPDDR